MKAAVATSVAGLDPNKHYYVKSVTGDNITVAATQSGAALNLTAAGSSANHTLKLNKPDFSDIEISMTWRTNHSDLIKRKILRSINCGLVQEMLAV